MQAYSQNDPQWKNTAFAAGDVTIGKAGCVITSLGNMLNKTPVEVNTILKSAGAYQGDAVIWTKAASALGMRYQGTNALPLFEPCLAETDHFKNQGYPQHFFILINSGANIIDPLDGHTKPAATYNIVSYRNISPLLSNPSQPTGESTMSPFELADTQNLVLNVIKNQRLLCLGHIDELGAQADTTRVLAKNDWRELNSVVTDIYNSPEAQAFRGTTALQTKLDQIKQIVG